MPLHRDIHWLGRQWAVTGHGLQLINQKQMGYYDIEIARLREPGVIEAMQSKAWIDRADFDKAVEVARTKFAGVAPVATPSSPKPIESPPAPSRTVPPPPARRTPVEVPPGPTLEELLAKLKLKSVEAAPAAKPVEAPTAVVPRPVIPKPAPVSPEPAKAELCQTAPIGDEPPKQAPPPPPAAVAIRAAEPVPMIKTRPIWPVFDRKIAGSARFVRPWRVTPAR